MLCSTVCTVIGDQIAAVMKGTILTPGGKVPSVLIL